MAMDYHLLEASLERDQETRDIEKNRLRDIATKRHRDKETHR